MPKKSTSVAITTITPAEAIKIIEHSDNSWLNNRPISQAKVAQYIHQMTAGEWEPEASVIHLDENGYLINGYHRMWAAIDGNISFDTILVRVADGRRVFPKIDTGRARSASDVLKMKGVKASTQMAAAVKLYLRHQNGTGPYDRWYVVTNQDTLEFVETHDLLISDTREVTAWSPGGMRFVSPTHMLFLTWIARNRTKALEYCYRVVHGYDRAGTGLNRTDPENVVRVKLMSSYMNKKQGKSTAKLESDQITWLLCKGYTNWLEGKKGGILLPRLTVNDKPVERYKAYRINKTL